MSAPVSCIVLNKEATKQESNSTSSSNAKMQSEVQALNPATRCATIPFSEKMKVSVPNRSGGSG